MTGSGGNDQELAGSIDDGMAGITRKVGSQEPGEAR